MALFETFAQPPTQADRQSYVALTPEYLAWLQAHISSELGSEAWTAGSTSFQGSIVLTQRGTLDSRLPVEGLRSTAKRDDLPSSYDARDDKGRCWVDPPECQGSVWSCAAFATSCVVESSARRQHGTPEGISLSEAYIYRWGGTDPATGADMTKFLNKLPSVRFPEREHYPAKEQPPEIEVRNVVPFYYGQFDDMKRWLVHKGPLLALFTLAPDLLLYRGEVYQRVVPEVIGSHAVAVIGYDDARQAWLVRNSFGPCWGEEGYGWMHYSSDNGGLDAAMWGVEAATPGT